LHGAACQGVDALIETASSLGAEQAIRRTLAQGNRENDDRRLPREIEGGGHRGKRKIDVDLLADHLLAHFPDLGKLR
ncbi:hypothetical protein AB9F43_33290, partial [Rhizobium leguminosarum]